MSKGTCYPGHSLCARKHFQNWHLQDDFDAELVKYESVFDETIFSFCCLLKVLILTAFHLLR